MHHMHIPYALELATYIHTPENEYREEFNGPSWACQDEGSNEETTEQEEEHHSFDYDH